MIEEIINHSESGWFEIKFINGNLSCFTKENEPLKINFNKPDGSQTLMNTYSLSELEKIVLIVLNSYIYSYEKIEKMICDNLSDKELSKQKELTLLIRRTLKEITEYINSYDEVVINIETFKIKIMRNLFLLILFSHLLSIKTSGQSVKSKIGEKLFMTTPTSEVSKINKADKILLYFVELDDEGDTYASLRLNLVKKIKTKTRMNVIDWRTLFPSWLEFTVKEVDSILELNNISTIIQVDTSNVKYGTYTTPITTTAHPTGWYDYTNGGVFHKTGEKAVTSGGETYTEIASLDLVLSIYKANDIENSTHEIVFYNIKNYNEHTFNYIYYCLKKNKVIN